MRKLNRRLGQKADFLNLVPGDLVFPWLLTVIGGYFVLSGILGLNWIWTGTFVVWACALWLLLAGRRPHRFFGQMLDPPALARTRQLR
ncbi:MULTISPECIES: hypothetical protein [Gloeobacter]|uniref:Gsl0618 protein n=2 Tax=Gloeobacter TaxID=33071 RepID=Q7NMZ7_GLOVI|nr:MULTISPECIES: hypothetical protein [Gloeobacter]UFP93363.1 hypothetical protein ISF26_16360 [Gloeobacter morelensis MG652769]BAC88559.1 gsl0618 [Gloeobacter violaceus PCC 7421]